MPSVLIAHPDRRPTAWTCPNCDRLLGGFMRQCLCGRHRIAVDYERVPEPQLSAPMTGEVRVLREPCAVCGGYAVRRTPAGWNCTGCFARFALAKKGGEA